MIELYHRTTKAAAHRILAEGFRDGSGVHPTIGPWTGIWLSDRALARPASVRGRALLVIELALSADVLAAHETVADRPPDRAFLLAACLINARGRIRRIDPVGHASALGGIADGAPQARRRRSGRDVAVSRALGRAGASRTAPAR
ncbi:MAG TPA: hypothetical protein VFU81_04115 [Thermomicrobiales bacterium]|nr:hypothetical protein [Thermomicrobiales bacterium]